MEHVDDFADLIDSAGWWNCFNPQSARTCCQIHTAFPQKAGPLMQSRRSARRASLVTGILSLLLFVLIENTLAQCVVPPPGLVAWWPGDGGANDIAGGNHGTVRGGTFETGFVTSGNGQAFSFDGDDDFVDVGNRPALEAISGMTIDAWINPSSPTPPRSNAAVIAGKGTLGSFGGRSGYALIFDDDFTVDFAKNGGVFMKSSTQIRVGEWNHVAATWDGSIWKLYLNGILEAESTGDVAPRQGGDSFRIGSFRNLPFPGLVDEVDFFSRALSADEIQDIFQAGSAGKCKFVVPPEVEGTFLAYFPQFAVGGSATTFFTVNNTSTEESTVSVELFRSDGSLLWQLEFQLLAGATETIVPDPEVVQTTAGWARISSTTAFSSTEFFQFRDGSGQLLSQVGVLPSTTTSRLKLFSFVDLSKGTNTGVALANPSEIESSVVTVRLLSPDGQLLETTEIVLGTLQHLARFFNEDPYFQGLDNFQGVVELSATRPLIAVTLRLDGSQLATIGVGLPRTLMEDGSITADKIAPEQVVKSLNSLTDHVQLEAGSNVMIAEGDNALIISAVGGEGGQGAPGPKGTQGDPGPRGPQGAAGIRGPAGAQGNPGAVGPQGPTGLAGPAGSQGNQGPAGSAGPQGDKGPIGSQGPQGDPGLVGPEGAAGTPGPQGAGLKDRGNWEANPDPPYAALDVAADRSSGDPAVASLWVFQGGGNSDLMLQPFESDQWVEFTAIEGPAGPEGSAGSPGPGGMQGPPGPQGPPGELVLPLTTDLEVEADVRVSGNILANGGLDVGVDTEEGLSIFTDSHVSIGGDLFVSGTLSKGSGSFLIDHPLDPANRYFRHSFVESPDMMNVYNGNVRLDSRGAAWIEMPVWFESLNRDFRYQLTAIGVPASSLHIAEEIFSGRFKVSGGPPGGKVSWQVTGIRDDPYAKAYRIRVEEDKAPEQRGSYLHPELYRQREKIRRVKEREKRP